MGTTLSEVKKSSSRFIVGARNCGYDHTARLRLGGAEVVYLFARGRREPAESAHPRRAYAAIFTTLRRCGGELKAWKAFLLALCSFWSSRCSVRRFSSIAASVPQINLPALRRSLLVQREIIPSPAPLEMKRILSMPLRRIFRTAVKNSPAPRTAERREQRRILANDSRSRFSDCAR